MRRSLVVAILLTLGLVNLGCGSLTPGEAQDAIAKLNRDLPLVRLAVASITTNQKLLADLDLIVSNTATVDLIVNH